MNIVDILKDCHGNFNELEQVNSFSWDDFNGLDWSYNDFTEYLKMNELNIENVYTDKKSIMSPFWYIDFDFGVYVELYNLKKEILESLRVIDKIKVISNEQKKLLKNNSYELFYFYVPKKFRLSDFNKRHKYISDELVFEVFKDIYISIDFGFSNCDEEMIQYVFSKAPKYSNDTDEITVYRGEGSESVSLELSHSWTTKYPTALFFAARYSYNDCKIYSAKIRKCDIIDFITDRNEEEVLCNYKDLKDVKELEAIKATDEKIYSLICSYKKDYQKYIRMIDNNWFNDALFEHSIGHIRRVLFYSLILSNDLNLTKEGTKILIQCAMLHDIGRTDDDIDDNHGKKSVDKINELNLNPLKLNASQLKIFKQIIANHSFRDDLGIKNLKREFKDENVIKLYKVFKDADALDRVRIKDLDINYLRFEESKEYVYIANALYILKF